MALSVQRFALLAVMVVAMFASLAALSPPAHADRCQPEELLGYDPIIPEEAHPVCDVLIDVVYPVVCDNSTTLATCTATVNVLGTGGLANQCAIIDFAGRELCAGTGGVNYNGSQPVFGPVDVAAITEANKVCVTYDFTGREACVGGRTLVTTQ